MAKNNGQILSHMSSLDKLVEYFDNYDLGDDLKNMTEVYFDVDIQKRSHVFAIDEDIAEKLTEIASSQKVPSEVLINSWLREKLLNVS